MKFKLTKKQVAQYEEWRDNVLKDVLQDELGVREAFVFIPCTIGMAVKVVCGEHQIDLTDYEQKKKL
jgi:hypothetical protein